MIVDASVLLATFFEERHTDWAMKELDRFQYNLSMSTINLTEVLIRLRSRQPDFVEENEAAILGGPIRFVAPDTRQALIAAEARLLYPLNLGDCFAYALAVVEDDVILTLDRDFRCVDRDVLLPQEDVAS